MDIATRYNLFVVEDAAQGMMSTYKGKALGTIGHLGAFSFHETKNYTSAVVMIKNPKRMSREEIMDTYVERLQQARERMKQLKNIKLIETEHFDRSKIVLSVKNLKNTDGEVLNGKRFQEMLRSYHLEMEMASGSYVIAMTGPGDTQEGMDRLVQAVMEIDKNILCEELSGNDEDHTIKNISYEMIPLEQAYSSFEAGRMEGESVKWNEASGRISLEYVYLYPPGIPMIVPGERITSTIVQKMVKYKEMGFSIEGLSQENCLLVAGNPE